MNTAQRISFATDMGAFCAASLRVTAPTPGTLNPDSILNDSSGYPKLFEIQCPPRNGHRDIVPEPMVPAKPCSVLDFITHQLRQQRKYDLSYNRKYINTWSRFAKIVKELNNKGLFTDMTYSLIHMDLEPRNIHLDVTSPTTAHLSGVLDWDEAVFAPSFLACKLPSMLWDFEGDDDEELDESVAHVMPSDADLASIKRAFDAAAGETFVKYTYTPEYRLARNIVRFAITGIHSKEGYEEAQKIIADWNSLRLGCTVRGLYEFDEDMTRSRRN